MLITKCGNTALIAMARANPASAHCQWVLSGETRTPTTATQITTLTNEVKTAYILGFGVNHNFK